MTANQSESKPVSVPTSIRLGEFEPRVVAICSKHGVMPPDFIRLAVRLLCERVEATGRYEIPVLGAEAILSLSQQAEQEHKALLAREGKTSQKTSRAPRKRTPDAQ